MIHNKFIIKLVTAIIILNISILNLASQDQTKLDSLHNVLSNVKEDRERCVLYIDIGDVYEHLVPDSAIYYYNKSIKIAEENEYEEEKSLAMGNLAIVYHVLGDVDIAMSYYLKSLAIEEKFDDKEGMARSFNNIGIIYRTQGNYKLAIENYEKSLEMNIAIQDSIGMSRSFNNIGIVYFDQGNYDKSIDYFLKSLKIREGLGDHKGVADSYANIGLIYHNQGNFDSSIDYSLKAQEIYEELEDIRGLSVVYNNIGNFHSDNKMYDEAIEYHKKSLEIKEQIGDQRGMSASYTNIGNVYREQDEHDKAIAEYIKALKIDEESGDLQGQAIVYTNIAELYVDMAQKATGSELEEIIISALEYGHNAYDLALKIGALPVQNNVAGNLKRIYKKAGNYRDALEFAEVYIATKDSMFNEEKTKALAEMQTKYETEKKQQEIEKQSLLIEKKELENKRQRNQRNFFIAGSVLMTIMVLLVFKGYQQKKKSNQVITEKNALLIEANEEIHAQKDEIEAQHNMVIKQKDHIEIQKTKIEDSIRYARRIQKAVLPKENYADYLLGEHFVIFRPKDVVSGDFYWATMINDWLVVAVADCTGHGVPGAFMSMLGVSYLNEIARKKEVSDPAQVLKIMRETVIEALDQTSKKDSQKDGMDMSLLSINTKTNQCFWAGAGIPLWIIRKDNKNKEFEDITKMVDVTKGDNMTLAISPKMKDFTCHKIELNKGDRIYLFSDGLVDQFGGPQGRKFMSKNLKTILAQTANESINNQKNIIEDALDNWMNPPESRSFGQIDDITMIGMEF
ncbi:MAG: tetratricopeptide repeat protein [Bacteroidales bacterium]